MITTTFHNDYARYVEGLLKCIIPAHWGKVDYRRGLLQTKAALN